ncbi:MAG: spherulation-specific family 4 protein [Propioniciclava sp.]
MRTLVPYYVHPVEAPERWARLNAGTAGIDLAIVNVNDGPGAGLDPDYREALAGARTPLAGYVDVAYGGRSAERIRREAAAWRWRYGVTTVFLDRVPPDPALGHWSLEVVAALRADGCRWVITNPGCAAHPEQLAACDLVVVFEDTWERYRQADPKIRAGNEVHLIHSAPIAQFTEVLATLRQRSPAYFWVSARAMPTPWAFGDQDPAWAPLLPRRPAARIRSAPLAGG